MEIRFDANAFSFREKGIPGSPDGLLHTTKLARRQNEKIGETRSLRGPLLRAFGEDGVADRRCGRSFGCGAIVLDLATLRLAYRSAVAQADPALFRTNFDDLEIVLLARLQRARALERPRAVEIDGVVPPLALFDLRIVAKSFDVVAQLNECAEDGNARHFAPDDLTDPVPLEPVAPDVVDLLHPERHAAIVGINLQDFRGHRFAPLEYLMGILYPPGPA